MTRRMILEAHELSIFTAIPARYGVIARCDGSPDRPPDVSGIAPDLEWKVLFYDSLERFIDQPLDVWDGHLRDNFELCLLKTDRVLELY